MKPQLPHIDPTPHPSLQDALLASQHDDVPVAGLAFTGQALEGAAAHRPEFSGCRFTDCSLASCRRQLSGLRIHPLRPV